MHRTTTLLLALVALAAAGAGADVASAAKRFVIRGAGYGHGVGMSQYGAYGYAQHGKDYRFILRHYYRGTALSQLGATPTVRVLLRTGTSSFSGATRANGRRLSARRTYTAVATGLGRVALRSASGRTLKTFRSPLRVSGPGPLTLDGAAQNGVTSGRYRGTFEFRTDAVGTLLAVNAVDLESYVRGVVGAESPASWPSEALRAQAVAARTYAITTGGGSAFDQYADTRSQMYSGLAAETSATDDAVAATAGQVVTYGGEAVVTYFFSTSGGRTEDVENSFIGADPKPWLRSVSDPYDKVSPRHRWGPYRMTMRRAAAKLSGLVRGRFRGIDVVRRGDSPRIVYADVVGSRGRVRVTGPQLRARFGLYDTWATFNVLTSKGRKDAPAPAPVEPSDPAAPSDPQTGGAQPGAGARASWVRPTGVVLGRISGHGGKQVVLRRQAHGRWRTVAHGRTNRHGRYRFAGLRSGRYRIVWRGARGPVVTL